MTRLARYLAPVVCAGLLGASAWTWAEEARPRVGEQPRHGYRMAQPEFPALPGFYMLRMESVQKELELTPEQIEKLKELGKKYYEDVRADQEVWKNWQQMSQEERSAKAAEQREKYVKRTEDLRQRVEKVLLAHQVKALKEINLRAAGPFALTNPRTLENLGVSDEQKQKLQDIRQKMFEELQEVQKKAFQEALEVLSPEQREKLKEQVQKQGY